MDNWKVIVRCSRPPHNLKFAQFTSSSSGRERQLARERTSTERERANCLKTVNNEALSFPAVRFHNLLLVFQKSQPSKVTLKPCTYHHPRNIYMQICLSSPTVHGQYFRVAVPLNAKLVFLGYRLEFLSHKNIVIPLGCRLIVYTRCI